MSKLVRFWWAFVRFAQVYRPDVIYAHDFYMTVPGTIAALATGAKLVYDAHELIIPESAEKMNCRARMFYVLEKLCIRYAGVVIAANRERAERMQRHYRLAQCPIVVRNIPAPPTCTDDLSSRICEFPILPGDACTLVYQGVLTCARGVQTFLNAMRYLPDHYHMIIIGTGPDENALSKDMRAWGLSDRCHIMGRVPREQLSSLLARCDVGLLCYPYTGLNNIYCAPNKVFEYAQAGLSMVSSDQPPLKNLFDSYGIGAAVDLRMSPKALASVIESVSIDRQRHVKALERFLSDHVWFNEKEVLKQAFHNLLSRGHTCLQ